MLASFVRANYTCVLKALGRSEAEIRAELHKLQVKQ